MMEGPAFDGWRCFHCDEHCDDWKSARLHFGERPANKPACLISESDLRQLRYNEKRVRKAREHLAKAKAYIRLGEKEKAFESVRAADDRLFDTEI